MQLLVAYKDDPAGYNMAKFISRGLTENGDIYQGNDFDLVVIPTPTISADWLEEKYKLRRVCVFIKTCSRIWGSSPYLS